MVFLRYTNSLKVLDVRVNKPFQNHVREQCDQFMIDKQTREKVTRQKITHWVHNAWERSLWNTWNQIAIELKELK